MSVDFPTGPAEGDQFTAEGTTWTYRNGRWTVASSGGGGSSLPDDAPGYLENDGAGHLTWTDIPALPEVPDDGSDNGFSLVIDENGDVVWAPTNGTDLPDDAAGVLTNDGAGALTWEPVQTLPDVPADSDGDVLTVDVDGNISWEPVPGADEYVKIDGTSVMTAPLQVQNNGHYGIVLDSETLAGGIVGKLSGVEKWGIGIHSNGNIGIGSGDVSQADNVDLSIRHRDHMSIFAGGEAGSTENGVWIHADGRVSLNSLDLQPMDATPKQYVDDAIAAGGGGGSLPTDALGYLHNDGAGAITWEDIPTLPEVPADSDGWALTIDENGDIVWAPTSGGGGGDGYLPTDGSGYMGGDLQMGADGSTQPPDLVWKTETSAGAFDGGNLHVSGAGGLTIIGATSPDPEDTAKIVLGGSYVSLSPGTTDAVFKVGTSRVDIARNTFVAADVTFTLGADPVSEMQAATKQYVDANAGGGGTVLPDDAAGVLTNDGAGVLTWEPDTAVDGLPMDGSGAMFGDIVMGDGETTGPPSISFLDQADEIVSIRASLASGFTVLATEPTSGDTGQMFLSSGQLQITLSTDDTFSFRIYNGEIVANHPITGITPTDDAHLATKAYVDAAAGGGGTVTSPVSISDLPPDAPASGDLWFSTAGTIGMFIYYDDGDTQQWVQTNGGVAAAADTTALLARIEALEAKLNGD